MSAIGSVLDDAWLTNSAIREFVQEWAAMTTPGRAEVVGATDDQRLIAEALDAGELLRAGEGRYYARSHVKDSAPSSSAAASPIAASTTTGLPLKTSQPPSVIGCAVTRQGQGSLTAHSAASLHPSPYG
ncbi:hypothetical protein GCM10011359_30020 [Nesterenkonia alkaliphila]|mgnify:CR=1 FL=1|nr:hypothetical protein GCM10011359_30020 [Nesterenkonia alkaliphila]